MIPPPHTALSLLLLGTTTAHADEAQDRLRDACFFVVLHDYKGPAPTSTASWFDDERHVTTVYTDPQTGGNATTQCIFVDPKAEKPMLEAVVIEPPTGAQDRDLAGIMNTWLEAHYAELAKKPAPVVIELPDPVQPAPAGSGQSAEATDTAAAPATDAPAAPSNDSDAALGTDGAAAPTDESSSAPGASASGDAKTGDADSGEVSQEASRYFWCAEAFHQLQGMTPGAGSGDWKAEAGKDYDAMQTFAELQGRSQLETEGFEAQDITAFLAEYAEIVPPQIAGTEPTDFTRAECDDLVSLAVH